MEKKKRVILNILAIVIGIATIIPIAYITSENRTALGQILPCFKADVPYAYVNLYSGAANSTASWDGVWLQSIIDFTVTPNARELTGSVAQIEFYKLHIYSEQSSLLNRTYHVSVEGRIPDPTVTAGFKSPITGAAGNGTFWFIDGTTIDGGAIFGEGTGGTGIVNNLPDHDMQESIRAVVSLYIADYDGNEANRIINELRNTQVLYMDVIKSGTISYQVYSDTEATVIILPNEEILDTIEFTKVENGFVCGEYIEGSVPFPMQTPSTITSKLSPSTDIIYNAATGKSKAIIKYP